MRQDEIDIFLEKKASQRQACRPKAEWEDPKLKKKRSIECILSSLCELFPQAFDSSLAEEGKHFFVFSPPTFWELRECKLIVRLIVSIFLLKRKLKRHLLLAPEKRHLFFRLLPTRLNNPFSEKPVWGVLIGVSIHDKFEHFDEEHVLLSVQKWMPHAQLVQGSPLLFRNPQDLHRCLLYLELDKKDNDFLTLQSRQLLFKVFTHELKERVQTLVPLLFSVRNEEQVMKNILTLSREIEDATSIPHMILNFEKQTDTGLIFTAILVYADNHCEVEKKIAGIDSVRVVGERKEIIGYLSNGFTKRVLVLHLQLKKTQDILREDCSVNLLLARQKIYSAIINAIGEIRDYDGGLLLKQEEIFTQLQLRFPQQAIENKDLMESFFYGITPIENQATISTVQLEALFSLALQSMEANLLEKGSYSIKNQQIEDRCMTFIRVEHPSALNYIHKHLSSFLRKLISTTFKSQEALCMGYILQDFCREEQIQFLQTLTRSLAEWSAQRKNHQVLRIGLANYPITLDPRVGGDLPSKSMIHLLFEGLMSYGKDGQLECAAAESVEVSSDRKAYLFHLRECQWSNGIQVSAHDFIYAWKKVLSPFFKTPFSHHLYIIKNARATKVRDITPEAIGIHAVNAKTLRVELEFPIPYFLELLTLPAFFPIPSQRDVSNPHWAAGEGDAFVSNGPFCLRKRQYNTTFILERNPRYRDVSSIRLDQIIFSKTDLTEALDMFKNNELDWIGHPFQPWSTLFEQYKEDQCKKISLESRVYWCSLNAQQFPLSNLKLRQALALALDKREIANLNCDNYSPAFSPLPPHHSTFASYGSAEGEPIRARHLFEEALRELRMTPKSLPPLTLIYTEHDMREKVAKILSRQWKSVLDLDIQCCGYPWPFLFNKVTSGDYELACIGWLPLVNNSLYTFEAFKWPHEPINFPKWKHAPYQNLVNKAAKTSECQTRKQYLIQAEIILIKEVPVIPLFYYNFNSIKKTYIYGVKKNYILDFKNAYINHLTNQEKGDNYAV